MDIRILQRQDAPAYWALRKEALQQDPSAFGETYEEAMRHKDPVGRVKQMIEKDHQHIFGAFINDELLGAATITIGEAVKIQHRATIGAVYVSPRARGNGAGKAIIQAIIEWAKREEQILKLDLGVFVNNEPAYKLYQKLGFETIGIDKSSSIDENGDVLDEYLMTYLL